MIVCILNQEIIYLDTQLWETIMNVYSSQRLLIISNIALSETSNTGKTILSYFDCLPKNNVRQLYFSGETPTVEGYRYFRIYDKDIIAGRFNQTKRGGEVEYIPREKLEYDWYGEANHGHGDLLRLAREFLWYKSWQSKQLWSFLDEFHPTMVFFVGGDFCAAYEICREIVSRYNSRLALYLTDDYLFPRSTDNLISRCRRRLIEKEFLKTLDMADSFFTISDVMREEYKKMYKRDSFTIVNMTESLKEDIIDEERTYCKLVYAGSIGLGRADVLRELSEVIEAYNNKNNINAKLFIYSNASPEKIKAHGIIAGENTIYGGQLNPQQLKHELNAADILVFVESFAKENIEITKFSLSTKVPEYMSVGKPILAIGPAEIGSMKYLSDVSFCISGITEIYPRISILFKNKILQKSLSEKAYEKFSHYHLKTNVQNMFLQQL